MSLKGSLDTAALPEVLQFLAGTGKSGELHVHGPSGHGRLWFEAGCISGFDAGTSEEPFEAIFELLRLGTGEFSFSAGVERPEEARVASPDGWAVDRALEQAQARLDEWNGIVGVVPSLAHRVRLRADFPGDDVHITRSQWEVVVAVGDGRTVSDVLVEKGLREFEGCRGIRDLVEASLVEVLEPVAEAPPAEPEPVAAEEPVFEPEPVVAEEPVIEPEPEPVVVVEPEPAVEPEPVDVAEPEVESAVEAEPQFEAAAESEPVAEVEPEVEPAVETEPVAEAEPEAEPVAATEDHEVVVQPEPADDFSTAHFPVLGGHETIAEPVGDAEDRYAALRAAMVDITADLDTSVGETGAEAAPLEIAVDGDQGRAALQALLEEVVSQPYEGAPTESPVDGLADRGPWTNNELAGLESMGGWQEQPSEPQPVAEYAFGTHPAFGAEHVQPEAFAEQPAAYEAPTAQPDGAYGADLHQAVWTEPEVVAEAAAADAQEEPVEEVPAEEPINRGLLLKFLSSVRN